MTIFFIFIFLTLPSLHILGQEELNGVYLTEPHHAHCNDNRSFEVDDEKYCIPEKPIIQLGDFVSVGKIFLDYQTLNDAIILDLNEKGAEKLKLLSQTFPERMLALIIKNRLSGLIQITHVAERGSIKIYDHKGEGNLEWVQKEMRKIINDNNQKNTSENEESRN